jgi:hyperosmotically inducible protein
MRAIRLVLVVIVVGVVGVLAYNYWSGHGWTFQPPPTATSIDAAKARERAGELTQRAAETTKVAAQRTGEAMSEAALTAKIKSKMALDDYVKARTINIDTEGSIVTLTGTVQSEQERQRALRLAGETDGVTRVVDKLVVASR